MDFEQLESMGKCSLIDELSFPYRNSKNQKFFVLNINIRGLNSNFNLLKAFLFQLKYRIDIIVITESHLDDSMVNLFNLTGYKKLFLNRGTHGGGLMVFINSNMVFNENKKMTGIYASHESLAFDVITPNKGKISIICIYRPPDRKLDDFVKYLKANEKCIRSKKVILLGGLNACPIRDKNKSSLIDLNILMTCHNFEQLIQHPTFISYAGNKSLLDHVWSSLAIKSESFVFDVKLADHLPSVTLFDIESKVNEVKLKFRDFSMKNKERCLANISIERTRLINQLTNIFDIDRRFEIITRFLENMCKKYFPQKAKTISFRRYTMPWLTSAVIKLINKKHRLFKDYKRKQITLESFLTYCKGLKLLLYKLEANYHRNYLYKTRFNAKKKWNYLNRMMGRGKVGEDAPDMTIKGELVNNESIISNEFGKCFKNTPIELQNAIPDAKRDFSDTIKMNPNSLFFNLITQNEVVELTLKMKNSNANDPLPMKFLKFIIPYFGQFFADEFNNCVLKGHYPSILNLATVRPILKSGKANLISNYRPISLIPSIGKLFEKIIYDRIYSFVTNNKLVSENQCGFVKGRSTSHASLKLMRDTYRSVEEECYTLSVFLDFSKAFDFVEHRLLLEKFHRYGIRGIPLQLVRSYLSSRSQRVKYRNSFSHKTKIAMGVPQGNVNGPLFYLLYCNDLESLLNDVNVVMYADDTVLSVTGKDINSLVTTMNKTLSTLSEWCRFNKLTINPAKSNAIIFGNKKYSDVPKLVIDNSTIEYVNSTIYLGLRVDKRMNFSDQISHVTKKLSSISGISYKLGKNFDFHGAKMFYFSFVHSYLSYCVEIWGGNLMIYNYTRLHNLWKRILLNLFSFHLKSSDHGYICRTIGILDPCNIYKHYLMVMMYKILHYEVLPEIVFKKVVRVHDLRSRDEFKVPFPRTNVLKANYYYQMCIIWNSLPANLKTLDNADSFKKGCKTYFLGL